MDLGLVYGSGFRAWGLELRGRREGSEFSEMRRRGLDYFCMEANCNILEGIFVRKSMIR